MLAEAPGHSCEAIGIPAIQFIFIIKIKEERQQGAEYVLEQSWKTILFYKLVSNQFQDEKVPLAYPQ